MTFGRVPTYCQRWHWYTTLPYQICNSFFSVYYNPAYIWPFANFSIVICSGSVGGDSSGSIELPIQCGEKGHIESLNFQHLVNNQKIWKHLLLLNHLIKIQMKPLICMGKIKIFLLFYADSFFYWHISYKMSTLT